ncbi:methyltransferase domain-containing protein [Xanthobacter sp. KR7-65]|uniref:class I SAM-dependent DNA methyltransferase n=1 Tax=Xanthobacter sp. KR7-65 TaxID=3156612 RepID=UPI0032B46D2D
MAFPAHPSTSGDPVLDRRLDWARAFLAEGDAAAAADLLAETVRAAPAFAAAWFLLGEARESLGDGAAAGDAYGRALALDPDDRLGAGLRRARLGGEPAQGAMSAAYVRTLFDQYADRFDAALRESLNYRGPELLVEATLRACAAVGREPAFGAALDLGCGTGLAGVLFAPLAARLEGVDLSPAMLEKARALGVYARLEVGEMRAALEAQAEAGLDLVLAADALCYVGDLAPIFRAAHRALAAGGLFAFTLETHGGDGVLLRETLRFAHGEAHVRRLAAEAGLALVALEAASTRSEKGVPVPGLVGVAGRG